MEYYLIAWSDISDMELVHRFYLGGESLGENTMFYFSYIIPLVFGLDIQDFEEIFPSELEEYLDFSLEPIQEEDIGVELMPLEFWDQSLSYFYVKEKNVRI